MNQCLNRIKTKTLFVCVLLLSLLPLAQSSSPRGTQVDTGRQPVVDRLKRVLELENLYLLDIEAKRQKQLLLGEWSVVTTRNGEKYTLQYKFQDTDKFVIYEDKTVPAYILEWDITSFDENDCCFSQPYPQFLFWLRLLDPLQRMQGDNDNEWWALPIREITGSTFHIDSIDRKKA